MIHRDASKGMHHFLKSSFPISNRVGSVSTTSYSLFGSKWLRQISLYRTLGLGTWTSAGRATGARPCIGAGSARGLGEGPGVGGLGCLRPWVSHQTTTGAKIAVAIHFHMDDLPW